MSNQLKEFFREKQTRASQTGIDWVAKRDDWIEAVEKLFDTIDEEYLAAVKDSVQVDRTHLKSVQEPQIGEYKIAELALTVGDEQVVFSPKGVNVIGAAGRVDVRGDRGEATLVRNADRSWSLVLARTPRLQLVPLTDETFLEMLRSVMR